MDYTIITGIVATTLTFLAAIFGQPYQNILNFRRRRKLKSLLNTNEVKEVIEQCDERFKESFIIPEIKESYFYAKTGITTNHKTIQKYINLKNELGLNWSWSSINASKQFIKVEEPDAYIFIRRGHKIFSNILIVISLLLIFGSMITLMSFNYFDWFKQLTKTDKGMIMFLVCVVMLFGFVFLMSNLSYINAISMQKRLNKVRNIDTPETKN